MSPHSSDTEQDPEDDFRVYWHAKIDPIKLLDLPPPSTSLNLPSEPIPNNNQHSIRKRGASHSPQTKGVIRTRRRRRNLGTEVAWDANTVRDLSILAEKMQEKKLGYSLPVNPAKGANSLTDSMRSSKANLCSKSSTSIKKPTFHKPPEPTSPSPRRVIAKPISLISKREPIPEQPIQNLKTNSRVESLQNNSSDSDSDAFWDDICSDDLEQIFSQSTLQSKPKSPAVCLRKDGIQRGLSGNTGVVQQTEGLRLRRIHTDPSVGQQQEKQRLPQGVGRAESLPILLKPGFNKLVPVKQALKPVSPLKAKITKPFKPPEIRTPVSASVARLTTTKPILTTPECTRASASRTITQAEIANLFDGLDEHAWSDVDDF